MLYTFDIIVCVHVAKVVVPTAVMLMYVHVYTHYYSRTSNSYYHYCFTTILKKTLLHNNDDNRY
jgi:HD superfamily phosphohydrolase